MDNQDGDSSLCPLFISDMQQTINSSFTGPLPHGPIRQKNIKDRYHKGNLASFHRFDFHIHHISFFH